MKNPLLDLLSTSLIPELGSDISTGTSCNVHLVLITVTTVRAFPHEFAVVINGMEQYFDYMAEDLKEKILKTELLVYECEGTESEIKE